MERIASAKGGKRFKKSGSRRTTNTIAKIKLNINAKRSLLLRMKMVILVRESSGS